MSYKKTLPLIGLLMVFIACKNQESSPESKNGTTEKTNTDTLPTKDVDQLAILRNIFKRDADSLIGDDDIGREVAIDSALQCTSRYEPEMYKHGIQLNAGLTRPLGDVVTRKITKAEDFAGYQLLEWMIKMTLLLDPDGLGVNIGFQLQMGIYTDDFLNTYFAGRPQAIAKRRNRIAIFIVPYPRGTYMLKNADKTTGYDLGGLQP